MVFAKVEDLILDMKYLISIERSLRYVKKKPVNIYLGYDSSHEGIYDCRKIYTSCNSKM